MSASGTWLEHKPVKVWIARLAQRSLLISLRPTVELDGDLAARFLSYRNCIMSSAEHLPQICAGTRMVCLVDLHDNDIPGKGARGAGVQQVDLIAFDVTQHERIVRR
jgi:hypothetical protein